MRSPSVSGNACGAMPCGYCALRAVHHCSNVYPRPPVKPVKGLPTNEGPQAHVMLDPNQEDGVKACLFPTFPGNPAQGIVTFRRHEPNVHGHSVRIPRKRALIPLRLAKGRTHEPISLRHIHHRCTAGTGCCACGLQAHEPGVCLTYSLNRKEWIWRSGVFLACRRTARSSRTPTFPLLESSHGFIYVFSCSSGFASRVSESASRDFPPVHGGLRADDATIDAR